MLEVIDQLPKFDKGWAELINLVREELERAGRDLIFETIGLKDSIVNELSVILAKRTTVFSKNPEFALDHFKLELAILSAEKDLGITQRTENFERLSPEHRLEFLNNHSTAPIDDSSVEAMLSHLRQLANEPGASAEAKYCLSEALFTVGYFAQALSVAQHIILSSPDCAGAYFCCITILHMARAKAQCKSLLEQGFRNLGNHPMLLMFKAAIFCAESHQAG